ncbi:hypothetical protein C8Q79DRAFT_1066525, partial [Trametes meyenii]
TKQALAATVACITCTRVPLYKPPTRLVECHRHPLLSTTTTVAPTSAHSSLNTSPSSNNSLVPQTQWPVLSRPLVSPLVARPPVSSSPPRPPARLRPPRPVVSRSPIVSGLVLSPSVRSVGTRSPRSSLSASSPSSGWSVRLRRTSRPICASSHPPSWPSRRRPRRTSSPCSRTPTLRRSTPSV